MAPSLSASFFLQKKCSFLSEDIMMHTGVTPNNTCIIISSEKISIFSEEIMKQLLHGLIPACFIISSEKIIIFSEEIMRHLSASPQHSWGCTVFGSLHAPHYFCQKKCESYLAEVQLLHTSSIPPRARHPPACQQAASSAVLFLQQSSRRSAETTMRQSIFSTNKFLIISSEKMIIFSEEIMRHAGSLPEQCVFIISSEKNDRSFLKK